MNAGRSGRCPGLTRGGENGRGFPPIPNFLRDPGFSIVTSFLLCLIYIAQSFFLSLSVQNSNFRRGSEKNRTFFRFPPGRNSFSTALSVSKIKVQVVANWFPPYPNIGTRILYIQVPSLPEQVHRVDRELLLPLLSELHSHNVSSGLIDIIRIQMSTSNPISFAG